MRYTRQKMILELIASNDIDKQETLVKMLQEEGYAVTQATVSRDIKDLQLVKIPTAQGKSKYAPGRGEMPVSERFLNIYREAVIKISTTGNLILIRTLSGCGPAVGEAVDCMSFPNIVGSVAGDNTVLLVVQEEGFVQDIVTTLDEMVK